MARIRTVKPEFFKHAELYDLEVSTGLPLRVAFAGLWTACDREGRFRWRPRVLKTDVLPHDQVDFADVLAALESGGFIERYEQGGKLYGWVPSWETHQRVRADEGKSQLPPPPGSPPECTGHRTDADPHLGRREPETTQTRTHAVERKGREGELEMELEVELEGEGEESLFPPSSCATCPCAPPGDKLESMANERGLDPRQAAADAGVPVPITCAGVSALRTYLEAHPRLKPDQLEAQRKAAERTRTKAKLDQLWFEIQAELVNPARAATVLEKLPAPLQRPMLQRLESHLSELMEHNGGHLQAVMDDVTGGAYWGPQHVPAVLVAAGVGRNCPQAVPTHGGTD